MADDQNAGAELKDEQTGALSEDEQGLVDLAGVEDRVTKTLSERTTGTEPEARTGTEPEAWTGPATEAVIGAETEAAAGAEAEAMAEGETGAVLEGEGEAEEHPEEEELSEDEKLMAKLEVAVEVQTEDIGSLHKKLVISVPRSLVDEQLGEQFQELRREADVPGFRRGRAPLRLVQKRYGQDVGEQISAKLVSSGYLAAVKKLGLDPLGDPQVWADVPEPMTDAGGMNKTVVTAKLVSVEKALDHLRLPKEGDFTFQCEVELKPQFELPPLNGIPVQRPVHTVTEEDVAAEIQRMLSFRARFAPVEGEAIQADDLIIGDVKLWVDGEAVKSETNVLLAARDMGYAGLRLKGLAEALIGKKAGDTVKLEVLFPDDYDMTDLRGRSGTIELLVQDVKRFTVPALTPGLISELGYADETDLRASIRTNLERHVRADLRDAMRQQISQYLLERADFALPEKLSQRQTAWVVARRMVELYQQGLPEPEVAKRVDELRVGAAEKAAVDLKLFFVMDKIAGELKIDVAEDELNGAIGAMAAQQGKRFDRMRDELIKNDGLKALYLHLRDVKILDVLLESAAPAEPAPVPAAEGVTEEGAACSGGVAAAGTGGVKEHSWPT